MAPQMSTQFRTKSYNEGQVIFREGQDGSFACIVHSGRVAVSKEIEGEPVYLATLERGAIFGEMALVAAERRTATVTALEYTEVVIIDRDKLFKTLDQSNPMMQSLVRELVARLAETNKMIRKQQELSDMVNAMAHLLHAWTEAIKQSPDGSMSIPFTKLVEYSRATMRISANRLEEVLKKLADNELIYIHRGSHGREIVLEKPGQIVRKAGALSRQMAKEEEQVRESLPAAKGDKAPVKYMDIYEMAALASVEPAQLMALLARGSIPETILAFPADAARQWAEKIKAAVPDGGGREQAPAQEKAAPKQSQLEKILGEDPDVLGRALGAIGLSNVTVLLAGASPNARNTIIKSYAPSMAQELMEQLEHAAEPDASVFQSAVQLLSREVDRFKPKQ